MFSLPFNMVKGKEVTSNMYKIAIVLHVYAYDTHQLHVLNIFAILRIWKK